MLPLPGLSGRDAAATQATLSVHPPGSVSGPVAPLLTLPVNPTEYAVSKAVTFAEIGVPGLDAPPLQFVRGGARTLKLDALVDAAEEPVRGRRDVQKRWLNDFQTLTVRQGTTHAPPVVP